MALIKDSIIYILGEFISKSVPFLLLPYLSRKLGTDGFGELSYFQAYLTLFVIVFGLSQEGAIARYFYFYGRYSLNLVIYAGYSYTIVLGIISLLICWLLNSEIMSYLVLIAVFQVLLSVQLSIRQCQKLAISYVVIQGSLSILIAFTTIILLEIYEVDLVEKRFLSLFLSYLIVFIFSNIAYSRNSKYKRRIFKIRTLYKAFKYIIGFGFPLFFHHISIFLRGQLDRIFIYHNFSETQLGIYAMGAQVASIVSIIIMAVNKSIIPYFFEFLKNRDSTESKRIIYRFTILSFFIAPIPSIIFYFVPNELILLIIGYNFVESKYYILIFIFSYMLVIPYLILVNYLFYYGKNKIISFCSILSTFIYLTALYFLVKLNIKLIPYANIIGAISIIPILWYMVSNSNRNKNE